MKRNLLKSGIIALAVMLAFSGVAIAQETSDGDTDEEMPQVVRQTVEQLRQEGWSEEDIEEFAEQARQRDWENAGEADPEVVAKALQLANQDREQLEGAENADLALELAEMAQTMQRSGFDRRDVARATFDGTREVMQDMDRIRGQAGEDEEGEEEAAEAGEGLAEAGPAEQSRVREQIREKIQEKLNEAMKKQARARERAEGPKGPEAAGDERPEGLPGDEEHGPGNNSRN